MTAALKNEIIKLFSRKKYTVLLILAALICAGRTGIGQLFESLIHREFISGNMIMEMFPFFAEIYVPLVVFMAACDLFSSEFHDLTIKASLMRPITRFKLMTAKIFAVFFVGIIFYGVIFTVCAFFQIISGNGSIAFLGNSMLAYLIDLVPLFVAVLFTVLINMLSKSPTLAMFMTIVGYALMKYCNYFIPVLNNMLFTSYMQWHKLWVGSTIPLPALLIKIAVLTGSAILMYTVSYILFDKKEY